MYYLSNKFKNLLNLSSTLLVFNQTSLDVLGLGFQLLVQKHRKTTFKDELLLVYRKYLKRLVTKHLGGDLAFDKFMILAPFPQDTIYKYIPLLLITVLEDGDYKAMTMWI